MIGETLHLNRLVKRYDETLAVDDLNLTVNAGEFVSVLGPSGSGKTSILSMVAGFERPSSGEILIGSRNVTQLAPNDRDIGMVFQKYALFPHLTVRQNIAFPLKLKKRWKERWRSRADEMLELVQLASFADRLPAQLSGGQQQRVAVARALAFEPPLMLMDEPLGALDKKLREAMQIEIKRIQQSVGATILYVTHDQEEALTMSDRVAIMKSGRVVQIGTPVELYRAPKSMFVADFVGRMNFLDGDRLFTKEGGQQIRLSENTVLTMLADCGIQTDSSGEEERVTIALRPELIGIEARKERKPNRIPGVIEHSIFMGAHNVLIVRLSLPGRPAVEAQIPHFSSVEPFKSGQEVDVIIEPTTLTCFSASERCAA
ncbi:ABC transporter ATP-binding protein [Agrobacterium sp. fls2-241-TYG-188a]|uniref:ABC transporter ATP-binding protein n=1 Tax=Agrobacterium sp. fls2-241-TYG-188a TaxID=3040275 RepID=UPI000DD5C92F|nr:ABC transporter ATP-binding protein [Agrobacterium sp. fls2-241-TYG-188a]